MDTESVTLNIDEIIIRHRARREMGDISDLTRSIQYIGMLYPVIVDRDNVLVSGARRIEAARHAGLTSVPALRMSCSYESPEALAVQADENLCRLPLSSEELDTMIQIKKSLASPPKDGVLSGIKKLFNRTQEPNHAT